MSSLLFLSADDFSVRVSKGQRVLGHDIHGISFVLFYSMQCHYCQQLIPIFKQLPETLSGCQFAMINVKMNRTLVGMAKDTITPITYVPLMILYVNGQPYMRYNGPSDWSEIRRFIIEVNQSIHNNSVFIDGQTSKPIRTVPAYTIGHPLCGEDGVCYLEYDTAYTGSPV
jgi:thiol-disulfide isomerase/thioredoxin